MNHYPVSFNGIKNGEGESRNKAGKPLLNKSGIFEAEKGLSIRLFGLTEKLDMCYNLPTVRSLVNSEEEPIIISTKARIKQTALALFSKRGYYGVSMSDIADAVGIVKASLYSHYSGKDALFLAVAADFIQDFKLLSDRLYEGSENMDIFGKLHYIFTEYIIHYSRNPLWINFATQSIKFVPDELIESFIPEYLNLEEGYRRKLTAIFAEGMRQGIIGSGEPETKAWSLKAARDGALTWLLVAQLGEEYIEEFWNDYWFGVAERNG